MFSKSRINEPGAGAGADAGKPSTPESSSAPTGKQATTPPSSSPAPSSASSAPKAKPPASTLSSDLTIVGNIKTTGDIQIEGTVEGDIRAHLLTVGEGATVRGECIADDVVVNGRVVGRVRGLKVRLTSTARVEGDIIHKTIAIESGAHFEGSVQRQDDPLASGNTSAPKPLPSPGPEAKAQG
ncbi:MAG: polymer-forming cytoskeletal protein [Vannielia sp.]|uniref:bactofilin family protein n=1 Tax=Rhodobacterales TaxID=204455 RepID=UPI00209424C3|nr:polymer-forming cytoskeletal protein [Oceanicola sp. 502str15]MCO6382562.1 polymer-forming cytoskeletal protein [Oceanicola sp. 502str15]